MADRGPRVGDLQAGLAEIDDRLREIQERLLAEHGDLGVAAPEPVVAERVVADDRAPAPRAREPQPERRGRSGPLADILENAPRPAEEAEASLSDLRRQVEALTELRASLLVSIRALLDGYEAALRASPGEPDALALAAGPFRSIDAVRAFERRLSALPEVREVSRRGYEGTDRAIVEVRLEAPADPTP
jgi:hypothetical protein